MSEFEITQKCPGGNTVTPGPRFRLFAFTAYNQTCITIKARFYGYGREVCPSTGRKHLQGFVYWDNAKTLSAAIKALKPHHVEVAGGTIDENIAYCSKGGDYTEVGDKPSQGARLDLLELRDRIATGTSATDLCVENPILYHQYGRTLERLEDVYMRKRWRTEMTTCDWLVGPTGVGKSHRAYEGYNPDTHYDWPNDGGWHDGYTQQHTVIINDFRGEIMFNELLKLIDKWPFSLRRRNRAPMPFMSRHIIITSPKRPEAVYFNIADDEDKIDQLMRRVTVIEITPSAR